nr:unnamed protein product [Callosobruchus analis]
MQYIDNHELLDDKLFKKQEGSKSLWVFPKICRWQICKLCHDDNGHFGLKKTLKKIGENYWFAQARHCVKKYVEACLSCLHYNHAIGRMKGDVVMILKTDAPCTGMSRKLLRKFKGPFRITKVLFNDLYEVQYMRDNYRRMKSVVVVDKIMPWIIYRAKTAG